MADGSGNNTCVYSRGYYWIYGDKPENEFEKDSDDRALHDGFVAVTPLSVDNTSYDAKKELEQLEDSFNTQ